MARNWFLALTPFNPFVLLHDYWKNFRDGRAQTAIDCLKKKQGKNDPHKGHFWCFRAVLTVLFSTTLILKRGEGTNSISLETMQIFRLILLSLIYLSVHINHRSLAAQIRKKQVNFLRDFNVVTDLGPDDCRTPERPKSKNSGFGIFVVLLSSQDSRFGIFVLFILLIRDSGFGIRDFLLHLGSGQKIVPRHDGRQLGALDAPAGPNYCPATIQCSIDRCYLYQN